MSNQTDIDVCIDKVAESGILPLSMGEIRQAINDNRELLRSRSSDILTIINSLNEKMKKNPVSLIDSAYGVRKFDTVKKQIRSKNDRLCHFVKDEKDYIPYLLDDLKLFFSPPSNFQDKTDADFRWIRDMLNVTCEPGSEITFEEILDLVEIDDTSKKMAQAAYDGRWAFTEVAQDICRITCLCADTDHPRMWKEYASTKGICVIFDKDISNMATKVIYNYKQEKPMDIRNKFVSLFEKLSDDEEAVKGLGRLFSLLFGEPFISPLFKGKDYVWENEWRIVRSSCGLPVDTNGNSYYQLDKKNIINVLISSEMNAERAKEIMRMCKKNELPYEVHSI